MIYFHWLIFVLYALVVLGSMGAVLMDNRQPAKTMAWLLVLVFIPVVGIILYFFFGQNTRKERFISRQSLDLLSKRSMLSFFEQSNLRLPEKHKSLIRLFSQQGWALPFKNNHVDIFTDGSSFFLELLAAIGRARHHIHLDFYIIEDDPLGRLVTDALIDKAQQGVEVRVIYDDVGCWNVPSAFFERMRDGGIDVHAFMPVKFPAFTSKVNYRNHRKLCVIDGREGFVGGMNIALRYVKGIKPKGGKREADVASSSPSSASSASSASSTVPSSSSTDRPLWRDTHLRIEGGAVYGIQSAFLVDWYFVDRTLITDRVYYPEQNPAIDNNCIAQIVTGSPISPWPEIMHGYVRILLEAKRYVYMETPYFLPTESVWFAMRTAALSGVDIRLMMPLHTDAKFLEWASRSYITEAIEAGVKVYFYEEGFNHSKMLVADDFISTCGSTNIDFRSFDNNFEANAFFYDEGMALRMKAIFMRDVKNSRLASKEDTLFKRPFLQRLWESIVRLFSPLL